MESNWIILTGFAIAALLLGSLIGTRAARHKADKLKQKNRVLFFIQKSI